MGFAAAAGGGVGMAGYGMTESRMRDDFPFEAGRANSGRRSSFGVAVGASAALGVLSGCGSGGGSETPRLSYRGGSGHDTVDLVSFGASITRVDAGAGDDTVNTGDGGQTITGGPGHDAIDGGPGIDTAVFAGAAAGYHVSAALDGTDVEFTVVDIDTTANGDDGTDTLAGIELVRFESGEAEAATLEVVAIGTDDSEILLGTAGADGTAAAPLMGMGGGDLIFGFAMNDVIAGNAGGDTIAGGAGDDTLFGHDLDDHAAGDDTDTAVFAGAVGGYAVTAAIEGGDVRFTVADIDADADGDDGMDTLVGFEALRFGNGGGDPLTLNVVAGGTAMAEIVVGGATADGSAAAAVDGGAGDDFMFGFGGGDVLAGGAGDDAVFGGAGDDILAGGAGDDTIDGGAGMDTAVFAGARDDYRIWRAMEGAGPAAVTRTIVKHKFNTGDSGDDLGMDTLVGVETLRFGAVDAALTAVVFDDRAVRVANDAAAASAEHAPGAGITAVYVPALFSSPPGATVAYGVIGTLPEGLMFDGGSNTLTGVAPAEWVTITFVASDDEPATGGPAGAVVDYDDVTHRYTIIVDDGVVRGTAGADGSLNDGGAGDSTIFGLAGDDVIAGGAGDDLLFGNSDETLGGHREFDTAAYAGSLAGYAISAGLHVFDPGGGAVENVARVTVEDIDGNAPAAPATTDEGTDTLVGFEAVRFGSGEDAVTLRIVEAATNAAEILLGSETADGTAARPFHGGGGDDFIFGFAGDDFISGGAGGDTIAGGAGDDSLHGHAHDGHTHADTRDEMDTAVFAGAVGGYSVAAILDGINARFSVEDIDGGADGDDGTDTLTGFEALKFGSDTLAVVTAGTGTAEILLGAEGADGAADAALDGAAGGDLLFGFGGDDFLSGGAGDDVISGGAGRDTAVFAGAREDFRVWRVTEGTGATATTRTFVKHKFNTGDGGDDLGRDTLTNVEMVKFGAGDAVELNAAFTVDDPLLMVASDAPDTRMGAVGSLSVTRIDASGWFGSGGAGVTYSVTASMGTATVSADGVITFTAPAAAGLVTLTVTASDDPGAGGSAVDYDDVSHRHVVTVEAAPSAGDDAPPGPATVADGAPAERAFLSIEAVAAVELFTSHPGAAAEHAIAGAGIMIDETSVGTKAPGAPESASAVAASASTVGVAEFEYVAPEVEFTDPAAAGSSVKDFPNGEGAPHESGGHADSLMEGGGGRQPEEPGLFEVVTPMTDDGDYFGL